MDAVSSKDCEPVVVRREGRGRKGSLGIRGGHWRAATWGRAWRRREGAPWGCGHGVRRLGQAEAQQRGRLACGCAVEGGCKEPRAAGRSESAREGADGRPYNVIARALALYSQTYSPDRRLEPIRVSHCGLNEAASIRDTDSEVYRRSAAPFFLIFYIVKWNRPKGPEVIKMQMFRETVRAAARIVEASRIAVKKKAAQARA
jgi:hypothetical protein